MAPNRLKLFFQNKNLKGRICKPLVFLAKINQFGRGLTKMGHYMHPYRHPYVTMPCPKKHVKPRKHGKSIHRSVSQQRLASSRLRLMPQPCCPLPPGLWRSKRGCQRWFWRKWLHISLRKMAILWHLGICSHTSSWEVWLYVAVIHPGFSTRITSCINQFHFSHSRWKSSVVPVANLKTSHVWKIPNPKQPLFSGCREPWCWKNSWKIIKMLKTTVD